MTTSGTTFFDRLRERVRATGGVLAVGLNPDPARLPDDCREYDYPRRAFNRRIIDATREDAAAYVVNPAFYEDPAGWTALAETVAYAHGQGVPVVVDGKWTDVEAGSPRADLLDRADAATLSPFCGRDALASALDRDCGAFVVCRTPNRGAADLQDRNLAAGEEEENDERTEEEDENDEKAEEEDEDTDERESVAGRVAALVGEWAAEFDGTEADVGLLVGGPSDDLEALRATAPDLPFLAVGGATNDPEVAEFAAPEEGPNEGLGLVEVSREVIYAGETAGRGRGADAYAAAARQSARRLKRQLNRHR